MLNSWRIKASDLEGARDAASDHITKAAVIAAQAARETSGYLEEWAKDGLESVRERPLAWSAASLGVGMLIGGLVALWAGIESKGRSQPRTIPARARSKKLLRAPGKSKRSHGTRRASADN